jgi:hypothetical protein
MDSLQQILKNQFARTPMMQSQDVYKLIFQAALGSEHAVADEQSARIWLAHEISRMGVGPDDPLHDRLSPDGRILRVHLRPYIKSGKDLETLLHAFIRTANEWHGTNETLKMYAVEAINFLQSRTGSSPCKDFETFFAGMESQGFPAAHHSGEYVRLYHPAYRVVCRQFLEDQ